MNSSLAALLGIFRSFAAEQPADLRSFIRAQPDPATLPPPWMTWTLIGLARHRRRQHWVAEIVRTRLRGNAKDLAAMGSLGHPDGIAQRGSVPGMPQWEYFFHGRGCCVTHKVNGDAIDVDFWDESADYFDTFFYKGYLESLSRPELPEQRLRELHPSSRTISIAIHDLMAAGALTPLPGKDSHPYCLSDDVVSVTKEIDAFCAAWTDPELRLMLAATIGDYLAAEELVKGHADLSPIVIPRAKVCREHWRRRLTLLMSEACMEADAIHALADLDAPDLDRHLGKVLEGPPSGKISAALEVIGRCRDANWCPRVYALFRRMDPVGQSPAPHIWMTSLKFLLCHNYRMNEVLPALAQAGKTEVGEAVLLSLEHAPKQALPLIRKALLADIPICRTEVAAILALIGSSWSKRELLAALWASDDHEKNADVRAALMELSDPDCERAVLEWEQRNPREGEKGTYVEFNGRTLGPLYSFGELSLQNRGSRITYEMQTLHDRVMKVKNVVPPDPSARRPWWKVWKSPER